MTTRIRELSEQMIVIARERVGGSRGIAVENDRAARLWRRLLKEAVTLGCVLGQRHDRGAR